MSPQRRKSRWIFTTSGSKTEVPTLFDGNASGSMSSGGWRGHCLGNSDLWDFGWWIQICLYGGFWDSPPFCTTIWKNMFGWFFPSIEQANPSEMFLASLIFLFCRSHFSTKCRVFSGCVRFSSIKKERKIPFHPWSNAGDSKPSPLRAGFQKRWVLSWNSVKQKTRVECLGSIVRINGLFHLLINQVHWGY